MTNFIISVADMISASGFSESRTRNHLIKPTNISFQERGGMTGRPKRYYRLSDVLPRFRDNFLFTQEMEARLIGIEREKRLNLKETK